MPLLSAKVADLRPSLLIRLLHLLQFLALHPTLLLLFLQLLFLGHCGDQIGLSVECAVSLDGFFLR